MVYFVKNWPFHELEQLSRVKNVEWIKIKVEFDDEWIALTRHPDFATVMSVWHCLVGLAAMSPLRGLLLQNIPSCAAHTVETIAAKTYIGSETIERALDVLIYDLQWMDVCLVDGMAGFGDYCDVAIYLWGRPYMYTRGSDGMVKAYQADFIGEYYELPKELKKYVGSVLQKRCNSVATKVQQKNNIVAKLLKERPECEDIFCEKKMSGEKVVLEKYLARARALYEYIQESKREKESERVEGRAGLCVHTRALFETPTGNFSGRSWRKGRMDGETDDVPGAEGRVEDMPAGVRRALAGSRPGDLNECAEWLRRACSIPVEMALMVGQEFIDTNDAKGNWGNVHDWRAAARRYCNVVKADRRFEKFVVKSGGGVANENDGTVAVKVCTQCWRWPADEACECTDGEDTGKLRERIWKTFHKPKDMSMEMFVGRLKEDAERGKKG